MVTLLGLHSDIYVNKITAIHVHVYTWLITMYTCIDINLFLITPKMSELQMKIPENVSVI